MFITFKGILILREMQ